MKNISTSANNSTLAISPLYAHPRRSSDNFNTPNQLFTPVNGDNPHLHNKHQSHVPSPLQQTPQRLKFAEQSSLALSSYSESELLETGLQPLSQAEKLRLWRHDALMQHHYNTASFIGDKVYCLTGDPNDAFWLAQVHYSTGNYIRAHQLLSTNPELSLSVSCRYLDALCLTRLNKWDEALDVLGEENPFKGESSSVKNQDGGIKLESSMCYLRGLIYGNRNNFDRAKECYKEAVLIDVKCYEAFDELVKNSFLSPAEEWELLNSLNFDELEDNSELIRNLYVTKLNKYVNLARVQEAESILDEEYNLGNNTDVLISRANLLFLQCKFQACLEVCEKLLENDEFNFQVLPIYLSTLHELGGKNKLFYAANKLAETYPKNCTTWLAIGIYYLSINKISEARKFFSKASLSNPNFGQAWIGFAHTFATEGEHEQAISAYSTAARLFPGTHLPNLFLGMQYLQMNNLLLAEEYMIASYEICPEDPLLLNEIGVVYFHTNDLKKSEWFFIKAFNESASLTNDSKSWVSINSNLGHVYRKMGQFDKALKSFNEVLKLNVKDANIYAAIGLIYLKLGKYFRSIEALHSALAISPNDPISNDLLKRALNLNANDSRTFKVEKSKDSILVPFKKSDGNKSIAAISTPLPKREILETHEVEVTGDFFRRTEKIMHLFKSTLDYKKAIKSPSFDMANSPSRNHGLANKSIEEFELESGINYSMNDPKELARELVRGEDTDDDDDAMDIESD